MECHVMRVILWLTAPSMDVTQQVDVSEVVLEEPDVSKAILAYITANKIQSIALGGACRNAFTKY